MKYMNRWEIDERCDIYENHPVLGPATRTLRALADAADANSDGWAYWPKPVRAATRLMEMIERDGTWQYSQPERPDVSAQEYKAALRPIKAFRTRSGIDFTIEEIEEAA